MTKLPKYKYYWFNQFVIRESERKEKNKKSKLVNVITI